MTNFTLKMVVVLAFALVGVGGCEADPYNTVFKITVCVKSETDISHRLVNVYGDKDVHTGWFVAMKEHPDPLPNNTYCAGVPYSFYGYFRLWIKSDVLPFGQDVIQINTMETDGEGHVASMPHSVERGEDGTFEFFFVGTKAKIPVITSHGAIEWKTRGVKL